VDRARLSDREGPLGERDARGAIDVGERRREQLARVADLARVGGKDGLACAQERASRRILGAAQIRLE
jgi:hypothetical protein